ncbi:hypothetical protein NKG05_29505 [Oerskovia sp. M15]
MATAVTLRVDVVHQGEVIPGQEVTVLQSGGVVDGVTYQAAGDVPLTSGERYLLFAGDGFEGMYYVLGGSAGTYLASEGGVFTAAAPDAAPFEQLTSSEITALADE